MNILILGGTGAMGIHLVHLLYKSEHSIYVTSRSEHQSIENIHYIHGNARNIEFLKPLLKKHWDVIIDFMVYSTNSFQERVAELLIATKQYIFLSSARVYADSEEPITENSPRLLDISEDAEFLSTNEYSLSKARQEDMLKNSGMNNWTIIRPYITYSENRFQLGVLEKEEWLYRALHGRTIVFSEDIITKITTLTYGYDVSKSIISLLGNTKAYGETFHITTHESITWHEVLNIYRDVIEKHTSIKPKVVFQNMSSFLQWRPSLYQIKYDRLFNRIFSNTKIAHYNNFDFTSVEQGLTNSLETFLANPDFKNINWKAEAIKDRYTKEYTPLKEINGFKQKMLYLVIRNMYFIYTLIKKRRL
ncbi:MAG: NAD-dependent epimerase/dehydratase family protein [bacterium]